MLQQNLMFGIQNQIKANKSKKEDVAETGLLESTEPTTKESVEEAYNPGFMYSIYEQTENAKKKLADKRVLTTESFNMNRVQKKLSKDINYFNYLFENFVQDELKGQYESLLESVLETTIRLYQECDVTPRVMSPAMQSEELTESQLVDIYKSNLNYNIKEQYTKPLLSGKVAELYESQMNTLVHKLVEEGIEVDMDAIAIYLPFEESMYSFNRSVLIPEAADMRVQSFIKGQGELVDLFENTAADILQDLEKKIKLLTSLVSPGAFDAVVDSDVDGKQMAGITIISDDNFADKAEPCIDDICPAELDSDAEASEELEDELEASEDHDEDDDGVEDLEDTIPGIETIEIKDELTSEEEEEIEDESLDVQAVEDSDGTEEGDPAEATETAEEAAEEDAEEDATEEEGAPDEAALPGGSEEAGEEVESDDSNDNIEATDEEVNSDAEDAEEEDELVEAVEDENKK